MDLKDEKINKLLKELRKTKLELKNAKILTKQELITETIKELILEQKIDEGIGNFLIRLINNV